MKKLTLIFTLLFSTVMFSSPSYAEWTKVEEDRSRFSKALSSEIFSRMGHMQTKYVDFDAIKKSDGYVYFGLLTNISITKNISMAKYNIKQKKGDKYSHIFHYQIDCKTLNYKLLKTSHYKEPMGRGTGEIKKVAGEWIETPSWWEEFLRKKEKDRYRTIREKVCEHANSLGKN